MRQRHFSNLDERTPFDVVIIGGGVTGAPIYHELCRNGYRVAIIDKGDFASGTSQASGMMVWGGLLYLKQMDILTVHKLCKARDSLIKTMPTSVACRPFRFLPAQHGGQNPWFVMMGLYLYWLLGDAGRHFPENRRWFNERELIREGRVKTSLLFEEGFLEHSDSRYVLSWIRSFNSEHNVPLNHCRVVDGQYDPSQKRWRLDVRDGLTGIGYHLSSKVVINCAGVWTDGLNERLGILSDYKHVMSKGVYINLPREAVHGDSLIFEMDHQDDVLTYVPWGPVSMWGPTETPIEDIRQGLTPDVEDIRFLLSTANKNLKKRVGPEDIISLRCGIRPLAVDKGYSKSEYPLELSRKYVVANDRDHHALAVYGGKLTTSVLLAQQIARQLADYIPAGQSVSPKMAGVEETMQFPGISKPQVTAEWAREHEFCCGMADYLRRRTTIAQWTPRMGLGRTDENRDELKTIASVFADGDESNAESIVAGYGDRVRQSYDDVLKLV